MGRTIKVMAAALMLALTSGVAATHSTAIGAPTGSRAAPATT